MPHFILFKTEIFALRICFYCACRLCAQVSVCMNRRVCVCACVCMNMSDVEAGVNHRHRLPQELVSKTRFSLGPRTHCPGLAGCSESPTGPLVSIFHGPGLSPSPSARITHACHHGAFYAGSGE